MLALFSSLTSGVILPSTPPVGPAAFARAVAAGKHVEVSFEDGHTFLFHALWLRDACRDERHVARHAGERYLTATPVGPSGVCPELLSACEAVVADDGLLHVTWSEESFVEHEMAADAPRVSMFEADFLRSYAEVAAERVSAPAASVGAKPAVDDELAFLAPYCGFAGARAPSAGELSLWKADELEIPVFQHEEVLDPASDANLRCIRAMLQVGCVAIEGCDEPGEAALRRLADEAFGGCVAPGSNSRPLYCQRVMQMPHVRAHLRAGYKRTRRATSPTGRSSRRKAPRPSRTIT